MELFIQSTNPALWRIVTDGPIEVKTKADKWSDDDMKNVQKNAQAMNLMYCALGREEFNRVSSCKSAKEIWDKLCVTYEGTNLVKSSRINMLKHEFELFQMNAGESIRDMCDRFQNIVNKLEALGKIYENEDLVRKILWSLPKQWRPKITAIEESKNLADINLDELYGSLITHEEVLKREEVMDEPKVKKIIAFRTEVDPPDDDLDDYDDNELSLLSKHVSRLLKFRRDKRRNGSNWNKTKGAESESSKESKSLFKNGGKMKKESSVQTNSAGCFNCGKLGHIKAECPWVKREKAFQATWDGTDSDEDTSESEEVQAFMATTTNLKTSQETEHKLDVCYQSSVMTDDWVLDSGCSHNMTGNRDLFHDLKQVNKGKVSFGDNSFSKIIGIGSIKINDKTFLNKVFLVEGLKHNLLSISQICGDTNRVIFESDLCYVESIKDHKILFTGFRRGDIYVVNLIKMNNTKEICLLTVKENERLAWHRKLGHVSIGILSKLSSLDLVKGLPKLDKTKDFFCDACAKGKQTRSSFKSKSDISSKDCLDLIHLDLFGPASSASLGGKSYVFVLVDDFSRYSWIFMLASKDETFSKFKNFVRRVQNEKNKIINEIRSDHGGEFENNDFETLCNDYGIRHNFSAPRTPQQNGVVERKNRTLVEIARTLLHDFGLPKIFWGEAVNTACYITNRALVRSRIKKTPYEIWKGRKPNIGYFRPFGCKCFILNTKDQLGKFDAKSDEGIFLGYSDLSKAYRVYNKRTFKVEESINVIFDESTCIDVELQDLEDEDFGLVRTPVSTSSSEITTSIPQEAETEDVVPTVPGPTEGANPPPHIAKRHPPSLVIGNPSSGMITRSRTVYNAFVSIVEPKNYKDALTDENWILAMNDELDQFERSDVWTLVPLPENRSVIGTKWVFRNKSDEKGNVIRNKARLVAQGYCQEEGIDYDETFAPVARLEAIRLLCAFASINHIKLFQMDVKSAFLNGDLKEEVFVAQPPGFENFEFPDYVFKLKKALYGLKQAPRAWYEKLSSFLLKQGFSRGSVDTTLFIHKHDSDLLIVQIYVDDIIFGSTNDLLSQDFGTTMQESFEMSLIGELSFFLGLQIRQDSSGIFICQTKYCRDMLNKFHMSKLKHAPTPLSTTLKIDKDEAGKHFNEKQYRGMIGSLLYLTASRPDISHSVGVCARFQCNPKESHFIAVKRVFKYLNGTSDLGLWYSADAACDLIGYSDSDFAGSLYDRRSTSGACQFLGFSIVSWLSKKQSSVALSTAEAEYIAAGSCATQLVWMRSQLIDYGHFFGPTPLYCDNSSAINMTRNPVHHSRTKHIAIKHHFIRDLVQSKDIELQFVSSENQLADIFTKALPTDRFLFLRRHLGLLSLSDIESIRRVN
ncbi:Retrovirus-related Pol polyprotein from transposon TNT 1-94 [Linum perenne]